MTLATKHMCGLQITACVHHRDIIEIETYRNTRR
jgi:hypothetical protein